jgi:hypothetical protein
MSDICMMSDFLMSDLFVNDGALFVEKVNKQQRKLRKKQLSTNLKKSDIRHISGPQKIISTSMLQEFLLYDF